jgi:hypothetical protein
LEIGAIKAAGAITIVSGLLTYNLGHNPRNAKNQKPPNYFVR